MDWLRSSQWSTKPEYNLFFLKAQQNYATDQLNSQGYVFLNDIYDLLGFKRTTRGALVDWVYEGDGDGFVDFGLVDTIVTQKTVCKIRL